MEQQTQDPILLRVLAKYYERSQTGIKKYGRTLDRDDLSFLDWLTHLQEELMDATLYIEKLKDEARNTKQNTPKSGTNCEDKLNCACYGSNAMHECNCK
ncbi:hypothetical protein UFOVP392_32 [uncultured Caudovirales phage]|uniref:Uncharacterized protein n=1 Tax=uncultured Caudovirales phage TaxID=2100421 RepID=A0A6J7X6T0_9CAUD|nr:hypothetical protein UFOVP392_32 [uncultured Caudovirales phage]